ncbi:ABC transporter ATP-binding protein [Bacillaceae bacterium W0354]
MLSLKNISYKKKEHYLLKEISGDLDQGDCMTIFGPNGAGKSTLLRIMAGLNKPTEGIRQAEWTTKHPVGYVPQQLALFEGLSVQDHISFYKKMTKQKNNTYIDEMIDVLDLESIMKKRIDHLSGGQKRKVNLAVGIIHQPEIIFLDEAFVGVDLAAKYDMLNWLKKLNERGVTIVFITHDWNVIHALAKNMWIIDGGKLIDRISIDDVHTYTENNECSLPLKKMFESNIK